MMISQVTKKVNSWILSPHRTMTNWNEAIRLNNHAVLLLHTGNSTDDETIIRHLQEAVGHFQICIREEMITPATAEHESNKQSICCTLGHSSQRISNFQDSDFFLFDQAFLLFENDDLDRDCANGSATLSRKAWIKSQSAIVLFNLALTFHRRANLRFLYESDPFKQEKSDATFLSQTRSLFEKSKLLYRMAQDIAEEGCSTRTEEETDLFQGTKLALRLGIANNLVHISACTSNDDQGGYQQ
jgi:hypothetical protein